MDRRRAIAERNVEAILDAAERVLARREPLTISSVAAESGLSRVTVYAHFDDRTALLAAAVERAVARWTAAAERIEPDRGPADDALRRLLEMGWEEVSRSAHIADAAAAELSAETRHASHAGGVELMRRLVARGRAEGAFRTDVPAEWLVSAVFALIHATRDAVAAGDLDGEAAHHALLATVPDLFAGR
jgi:TetR/AcrR family transcriptional regulator, mexCD-oprJ operon repressor